MLITSRAQFLCLLDVHPSFIFSAPLLSASEAPAYLSPTGLVAQGSEETKLAPSPPVAPPDVFVFVMYTTCSS